MHKLIMLFLVLFSVETLASMSTEKKLEDIENRLGDLEVSQALRKFRFSGIFINQIEEFSSVRRNTDLISPALASLKADSRDTHLTPVMMRVAFNISAEITQRMNFYSTIGMAKFWNLADRNTRNLDETGNFQSLGGSYTFKDSRANFDMAYISYNFANSNWTLAMGRMPTNNGPPLNRVDGVKRTGTYPSMSYNNIMDGVAGIYSFNKYLPKDNSLKFRLFYTPFIRVNRNDRSRQVIDDTASGSSGNSGEPVDSHSSFYVIQSEYERKNLSWAKEFDFYLSHYHIDKFYSETKQKVDGTPPSSLLDRFYHNGIEYFRALSTTVYLGVDNLLRTGFGFTGSFTHYDFNYAGEDYKSDNVMFTVNYTFDNKFNAGDVTGIEYLKTDKNRAPTEETTIYVNPFYNMINGEGAHVYYTKVINANQIVRFGHFSYQTKEARMLLIDLETKGSASYVRWKVFF